MGDFSFGTEFLPPTLRLQDFLWVDPMTLLFPLLVYTVADMTCIPTLANLLSKVKNKESCGFDLGFPGLRGLITSFLAVYLFCRDFPILFSEASNF